MAPDERDGGIQVPENDWEILRDCRALYLKQLAQLLKEGVQAPADARAAFVDAVGHYFDDKVVIGQRTRFDQTGDLTASQIMLVGENDLELDIRLADFASRLGEGNSNDLWRLYLRFVTLLGRPDMSPGDNPLGPKAIANGLVALSGMLGEDHLRQMDRIDRMQDYFAEHLPVVYAAVNEFLIGRNVSAAQPGIVTAPDAAGAAGVQGMQPDPAAALQNSLLARGLPAPEMRGGKTGVAARAGGASSPGGAGGPVATGAGGSGGHGDPGLAGHGAAASLLTNAMFSHVLERLDEIERASQATPGNAAQLCPIDSARLGIPLVAPEAAAIDALAMIFEAIFTMPDIPDPIRMVLASLQIPTLRAAMLDPRFFTADAHPARQLIDKIARAGAGLPFGVSSRHPLCMIIGQVAARVRTEFVGDNVVLSRAIAELDKLIARRDAAAGQAAAGYHPLLEQLEQGDQADQRARQAVEEFCVRSGTPPEIVAFLREHWQRLLRQIWLEHDGESADWHEHKGLVDRLLWSVRPKADLDERKALARELPQMLERLTAGMQRIAMPDAARAEFLDACFRLQTAAMRGLGDGLNDAVLRGPAARRPVAVEPALSDLRSGVHWLRIYDFPSGARRTARYRLSQIRNGDWLSFCLAGEDPLCGRVCHVSKVTGKMLLANPDWEFAMLLHPAIVNDQLKDGRAALVSRASLFNTAAEQAMNRRS